MLASIRSAITEYSMLDLNPNAENRVTAAVSGGADSVAMLKALCLLKDEFNIKLSACHVNHNLRGAASDGDEKFVRELCESLNVPLTVFSANIAEYMKKHQSTEEAARAARYGFFAEISKQGEKIATAHNADDNAETVLLNLVRGTGLKGLCGIPPVRGNIIRPILNIPRKEVEAFIEEYNLKYVTDATNFSDIYTRNKLRLNVIPLLKEINPSLTAGITKMCMFLREDENMLSKEAETAAARAREIHPLTGTSQTVEYYDAAKLAETPSPLLRRIISGVLSQNNVSPSALRINSIEKILKNGGGKINIERDKFAAVKRGKFYLENIHQNYRKKT